MTAAVRGDFDEFYTSHFANIVTMTYSLTGSFDEAQDITQESFCRAWQRWARLSTYDNPITWVRRVAINLATSRWRRLRTATEHRLRLRAEEPAVAPVDSGHVEMVEALRKLPAGQRSALVLHYLLDLPIEQVAQQLQVPAGTVKAWLSRGRRSLAAQLTTQVQAVPAKPAADEIIQRARRRRLRTVTVVGGIVLLVLVAAVMSAGFIHRLNPAITPTPTPSSSGQAIGRGALCTFPTGVGAGFAEVHDRAIVAQGSPVTDEKAFIVTSAPDSGDLYVLWRGRLFPVGRASADRLAGGAAVIRAAQSFIDGVPKGQPIEPISVTGAGAVSRLNPQWTVGEVISVFGLTAEDRYVLVREDGLFYVTQLQAQLAAINGQRRGIGEMTDNGRLPIRAELLPREADDPQRPPSSLPVFSSSAGSSVCSTESDNGPHRQTVINVPLPR